MRTGREAEGREGGQARGAEHDSSSNSGEDVVRRGHAEKMCPVVRGTEYYPFCPSLSSRILVLVLAKGKSGSLLSAQSPPAPTPLGSDRAGSRNEHVNLYNKH